MMEPTDAEMRPFVTQPIERSDVETVLSAVKSCAEVLPLAENFVAQLWSASNLCALPYYVGASSILSHRGKMLGLRHTVRARVEQVTNPETKREAVRVAEGSISQAWPSEDAIKDEAVLIAGGVHEAISELMRAALVLTWSAFEVLATDLFAALLNAQPQLIMSLNRDEPARRLFGVKAISIEELGSYGFDVSCRLGDLLVERRSLGGIEVVKAAFFALCANTSLRAALGRRELVVLNQQRNLIAHRRGIVDERFARLTSGSHRIGDQLSITGEDVQAAVLVVRDAGAELLEAAKMISDGSNA